MAKTQGKKNTALATVQDVPDFTDITKIPNYLETISQRITDLKGLSDSEVRIDESLGTFGRIKDITNPEALIHAYNYITSKAERYDRVEGHFKDLSKQNVPKFKENGFTLEQWQKEIDTAYLLIVNKAEIEKMEKLKATMAELLSEDEKKKMKLKDLQNMFKEFAS